MVSDNLESSHLTHIFRSYPRRRLGLHGMLIILMRDDLCMLVQVTRKIATMYGVQHSKAWHTNFGM